jgi:hypothetical protein
MDQTIALIEMYRNLKADKTFMRALFIFSFLSISIHATIEIFKYWNDLNGYEYIPIVLHEFTGISAIPFFISIFSIFTTWTYEQKFKKHVGYCKHSNLQLAAIYGIIIQENNKGYSRDSFEKEKIDYYTKLLDIFGDITLKDGTKVPIKEFEQSLQIHKVMMGDLNHFRLDHIVSERYGYYGQSGRFYLYENYFKILYKNYNFDNKTYKLIKREIGIREVTYG